MSPSHPANETSNDIVQPTRLTNPVQESPSHRSLHRELLFSHRRGLVLGKRAELQRALEQRRREQVHSPPSDLEQELHKRKLRLQEYEREELRGRENVPEFVRVKESLRHVAGAAQ